MRVLILGATGGTGREVVREAQLQGHSVTALVRSRTKAADLAGADLVEGDARDEQALSRALEGCSGVISSLGTPVSPFRQGTLLSVATRALVKVMENRNVRRLVCIPAWAQATAADTAAFFSINCSSRYCCERSTRTRTARKISCATANWIGCWFVGPCSTTSRQKAQFER